MVSYIFILGTKSGENKEQWKKVMGCGKSYKVFIYILETKRGENLETNRGEKIL